MEIEEIHKIQQIAEKNSELANTYAKSRVKAANAAFALDVLVGKAYLDGDIDTKMAYEKAILNIACLNETNKELYKEYLLNNAEYKGLEKIIEANRDQIVLAESKMKFIGDGEKYGG